MAFTEEGREWIVKGMLLTGVYDLKAYGSVDGAPVALLDTIEVISTGTQTTSTTATIVYGPRTGTDIFDFTQDLTEVTKFEMYDSARLILSVNLSSNIVLNNGGSIELTSIPIQLSDAA